MKRHLLRFSAGLLIILGILVLLSLVGYVLPLLVNWIGGTQYGPGIAAVAVFLITVYLLGWAASQ